MCPIISVIIPAYNAEKYIAEAIQSIFAQSFTAWELIVVNDGSIDGTPMIIDHFCQKDDRIVAISQKNRGVAAARIAGLQRACGTYIYFLDADDYCLPNTLEWLSDALNYSSDAIAAYGLPIKVDRNRKILQPFSPVIRETKPLDVFLRVIEREFLMVGTVLIRRESIASNDLQTSLSICEDWLMWCRLAAKGQFIFIGEEPLMEYRRHTTNTTNRSPSESVRSSLTGLAVIFSDPVILQRLTLQQVTLHRKTGEFFIYFEAVKDSYRQQRLQSIGLYLLKALKASFVNFPVCWHIAMRLGKEVRYWMKTFW